MLCLVSSGDLFGLVFKADRVFEIDILDAQLPEVQAAIDRGDISVNGMSATIVADAPKSKSK